MTESLVYNLYINGKIVPAQDGKDFESVDPSTGKVFARVADASAADMESAIAAARKAFDSGAWSGLTADERGEYLLKIAQTIRQHAKELADLESRDTGKTGKQTTFIDVPTVADTFEYFAKAGHLLSGRDNEISAPVKSRICHEPMGVVGCVIPWNYPLIMFGWKVAPALLAGNTIVFRPSATASVAIMRLAQLIAETGLPEGVLNIVPCKDHTVAQLLVDSPGVDMITFTGGTKTGQDLMRRAAGTTKKLTMELGGKSPNIVFADCDQQAALGGTLSAIFMNQGQMCTAGSRLFVEDGIYDDFVGKLVEKARSLKVGPADDYSTDFGPLASASQLATVQDYVGKGQAEGARLLCGGKVPEGLGQTDGFYFEPTIFADVTPEMTIVREEIFGPVLCVFRFSSEDEAVSGANNTDFGLAACLWTKDEDKARRVGTQLRCGTVWVNTYGGFYNEAPYGGYKQSGFGRELGAEGLLEYTQTKHICVDATPGGQPLVSSWF